ncbi:MAG TPA: pitrilysin family protein [Bdellovibrionales bacterium]|nr:pitrilysin family protein [Bdellovibrionales bacterium]
MRYFLILALCFQGWAAAAVTSEELEKAIQLKVEKYELKNGLTVILHPDNSIPSVSVHSWFRVGSKDEWPGRTGLAHFFEHMMFKGTKKYPKDTWGKFLNGKGADMNAFTSVDYTGYFINAPSAQLELLLDIESDRMRHLLLDPKEVASEREVVKEERRMRYEDNIDGSIREKMAPLMFESLPYKWLPIGSMDDLNAASMDDMHKFYKAFYSPNNAVLTVAGAFDVETTKKLIDKYYAGLPREQITRPRTTPEKEQTKERKATIEREAQAPTVAVGYRTVDLKSDDHYALDLLSILLGQGQSSRLYRELVHKDEIALNTYAASWGQTLDGQFSVHVTLKPGIAPDRALTMVEKEVRRFRDTPVTQKELDKARNLFLKDYVDGLKKVSGRARTLAMYETVLGDYKRVFTDLTHYQKVTAADVQRVAKKYLKPERRNTVVVMPKKAGGRS